MIDMQDRRDLGLIVCLFLVAIAVAFVFGFAAGRAADDFKPHPPVPDVIRIYPDDPQPDRGER